MSSSLSPEVAVRSYVKAVTALPEVAQKQGFHPPLAVGVQDAARITGVSVDWLNQMRSKGTGPRFCKIGRRALYLVSDLESWLADHLQPVRAA